MKKLRHCHSMYTCPTILPFDVSTSCVHCLTPNLTQLKPVVRGRKSRGNGGQVPRIWSGNAYANFPPDFKKISPLDFTKTHDISSEKFIFISCRGGLSPPQTPPLLETTPRRQPSVLDSFLRPPRIPARVHAYAVKNRNGYT